MTLTNKQLTSTFSVFLIVFFPSIVSSAFPADLKGFVNFFLDLINIIVPLLSGFAFLMFFWGVAKFILNTGDTKLVQEGKKFMIYGVFALFVLLSISGILQLLSNELEFGPIKKPYLPE